MTSFQQSIDRWSNLLDKPLAAAEPPPADGIDITDNFGSLISEARAALTDATAAPGSATADQDLIASAAESNKFETMMPDTSWAGLNLREVARGSQQQMSQAAAVIATPSLRAELIQSLMKPAAKIAEWLNPPKTEYELAIQNLTKRNLAQQLSMAVEPAGSGLTASPQDLQSEIIALRGTQQGLAQGQQEGFMGDVSRGVGQSAPSLAVTAGTLATGGALLPMVLASQVTIPMSSYTNSQLAYIDDLEQQRYDQALAGETLSEFDPVEMGRRAEIGAIIETTAEAGGAAFGASAITKVAKGVGTSSAARFATNKFAKTGAAKAATEVVRRSGSAAGRAFAAANEGLMNFTPGFIYRAGQIAAISGAEEAGEELFAGIANAPFTYAPLGQDVNDALYSMAVGGVAGGVSGAASSVGLAGREAVINRNDAFRPETDRERIVRQTHSDAMKARSNWSEGLEQTQRDRIAAKLDTIEGMTPDERGTYVMALADRKAEIIANAEGTLAERQEVDVAMTGAQEVLDKAKAAAGTASPTADQDIYEAEFALLVLQDKAKQLDQQLVMANTDHMIATAEHGAVAEKISDMPATVVRSTPVEVLASVGTRSGVALNETKAPRWGKKIANEMEALGTQVVWYTPADKKSSNPGFHSRRTPGVIYLNAASNQQRVRAVALEEAFHDIQMFRPDIAQAFVDKAGLLPVYDAALEYVSRGGAETAAIERQDEAAFAQAENVAATLEGETSDISPNTARAGAARISQEGEANAFARAMAGIKAKGAMSSLTRLAARSGLMGRESLAAMAVVDRVARSAAIEAVSGKTGDATLSPLARTLMWASDMDVDFARDIPTADRELSEPISPPPAPVAAKPKMDRVAHKREKESGRYVGAPDWVGNSPAQLAKLRFKLRKLAKEGEAGRYWYEDSSRAILEMTGGDKVEAEKIVSLIAIYSPNATVSANTTMALTAYYQFKAGLDINAGFSKADEKATALLKNGQAWGGIKTNSFYQNLMVEIDPSKLDTNVSTMDMWMAIAFDYGDKVLDQGPKYRFAERETARLAQELGWTAHQVQAAIWSAMKGRIDPIRGQLKAEELRLGIGEMVNKVDPKTGKESLVYEVKKDKKKEHFRLAHKMGMEYNLQDKDINAAKFDFNTALRDRMVQQSYETTPSTTSGSPLPGIHTATLDKVFEYQRALAPVLFPNGKDIVAEMVGLPQGDTIEGVSAWESKVQTGIQSFVAAPTDKSGKAKRLKPSAIKLLDLAARIRGYALTQDAVAYHTAVFDDAKIRHNGIELRTNRALSHQEVELFYRALHEKFDRWDLNPIYRKDGLRVLNFTQFDKSQKPVSNKEFKDAWQTIVQSLPDTFGGGIVGSASFRSEGNNVSNDWSKDKNGEGYLDRITAERPDILGQVRDLRLAVQTVNDQFVAKYGWDKAGISFARSDERRAVGNRVEQPAAGTLTPLAGSPVIQGFTGPDPSIVDVAQRYAASRGIEFKRQAEYADVDPDRAARIADAYQTMVHDPQNPAVADAYKQLIEQTTAQYQMLVDAGYQFYFFDQENDPYADQPGGFANPYNAVRDLRANKRMAVFPSESGFGSGATDIDVSDNPLLADTGLQWAFGTPDGTLKRVTANDLFRAVHDAMGHSIEGAGFRARGEENAWQAHVRLFTGSAIGAMTSETRGQNSWLNFGPFGEKNKAAKVEDTTFADQKVGLMPSFTWEDGRVPDESFAREDERDAAFQKMQADRRAAQAEVMKDLSPREQALIIEAGVADYDEILDLKDKIDKLKKQIAGGTPAAVEKSKRTADLQTAAQRVNALSEVRKLERRLNAMTMLAEQRLGQVNRAKARLQTQTQLAIEEQQSAAETIASLEEQITTTRDAVAAAKKSIAEERTATKEQRDALNTALANAEATAQRAINWAYAIGRNEGLVAGQVAGQQTVQTDLERGQQAEEKLKELQKSERFQKFASQRAIDWAYRIGRNEGLVAGQVAGQQALKPEMTRLARVESLLDISVRRVRELKATVRNDARAAQRAVNFAYSMGLNKGRMQGIMQGRAQILAKMRKREDTLQNQLFNLRELMNTRLDDVAERNRIIRKITSEALLSIPANLRGTLANRAATATTVAQANRVAIEAVRIAINAEATAGLKVIARTAKRLNKRGMKVSARKQIVTLLYEANVVLRDANNRKRQAKVVTAKGSPVTLSGAIDLYSRVLDAQTKVENAVALYDIDRAEFIAERDQRIARYADLTQRLMANMAGRRVIAARARADQAARLSVLSKISRANSDIYTLALELEGVEDGVIDELLRLAQEGKGEAALEHARIMRDLEPALIAAGYEGVDDYRLKNGGYGDGSTELVTVSLGGQDVTIPLGIAMSIAAMDEETLALFDGTNAGKQGIQFNETSTTLTLYPSGDDIRNLRANLTVGQRDLIERMKDILETQIRDRAMQAIWEVTGDQPPIVTRYYPRIRNMDAAGGEKVDLSAAAGAAVRGALTAVGFANARVGGSQPLIYTDMVQTMDRHMQVALDMIHMAQPYRDAITVLNDPKVVKGIDDQLGSGTASGVRSIFSNGVGATSRTKPSIIDKLTSNVTGAKLAMNPSTIAKVLVGGTIRLSSEIPLSLWTRGTARAARYARTPGTWSGRIDQIHLVNGYFSRRHQMQMKSIFSGALGDSDRAQLGSALTAVRDNLRATGNNLAAGKITDAINAAGDANRAGVMGLSAVVDMLRYADEQIMLAAVEARLAEVEDEGLLTGTDALTEASNRAERDFRKTQNASDEFDDSYFAATSRTDGNAGWRLLFPFSSDPLKARNQIRRAVLSGNRTRTAFAVGGNIVSGATISSLSTIVTAKVISLFAGMIGAGDDEEEKKAVNKAWWENTLVSIPTQLAGDVMSVTMGYMGIMFANALSSIVYRRFLISPLIGSPAQDVVNEAKDALRKDSTTTDMMFAIVGGSLATLQYGGIPFYPLYRLVMRSLELGESAAKVEKTPREKLLDSMERKRKSLEKLRSN